MSAQCCIVICLGKRFPGNFIPPEAGNIPAIHRTINPIVSLIYTYKDDILEERAGRQRSIPNSVDRIPNTYQEPCLNLSVPQSVLWWLSHRYLLGHLRNSKRNGIPQLFLTLITKWRL